MIHFIAGPLDGTLALMVNGQQPSLLNASSDAGGWYDVRYDVAGERLPREGGDTVLTGEDAVAQWSQRRLGQRAFQVGDRVVIQASGAVGRIGFGPLIAGGGNTMTQQWLVRVDGDSLPTVCGDEDLALAP